MWSAITAHADTILQVLPAATVALRFGTALIGFAVTMCVFVRRVRGWRRRRR